MAVSESQFKSMPDDQKWLLYNNSKVDRDSFNELKQTVDETLRALRACEIKIEALEAQAAVNKTVNDTLASELRKQRANLNRLDQYGRRDNVVINIPKEDGDIPNLEEKVIYLFKLAGVTVAQSQIVAAHKMKKKGSAIVRFTNRKFADAVLGKAREGKFKNLDTTPIWGKNVTTFAFRNLTPENSKIRFLAKTMKARSLMQNFGTNANGVWIVNNSGTKLSVDLVDDLADILPPHITINDLLDA